MRINSFWKSNKILNKGDSVGNDDSIEIKSECSSVHNDGGEQINISKEKTIRKVNKSRRKPKTPNKIKISFSKSKKWLSNFVRNLHFKFSHGYILFSKWCKNFNC